MVTTVTDTSETNTRTKREATLRGVGAPGRGGRRGPNGGGGGPGGPGGPGGGGPEGPRDAWSPKRYRIGLLVGIASILMMFTALTSAYIVREGLPGAVDWKTTPVPAFAWVSTAVILASSFSIAAARKSLGRQRDAAYRRWLLVTLLLGLGFLASQLLAWRELIALGVYLASNPHSSFFYVLTALHGLHVLGGIIGLGYVLLYAWYGAGGAAAGGKRRTLTDLVALYWHFMDGLWVYLFLLLFLWR